MDNKLDRSAPGELARIFKLKRALFHSQRFEEIKNRNPDIDLMITRNNTNYHYGVFSKTLPHNEYGEVSEVDYMKFLKALESGIQEDYDTIPVATNSIRKLANPQASLAYVLEGQDNQSIPMPLVPSLQSEQGAAEMMEVYEMAMHRDVSFHFLETGSSSDIVRALNTLNAYGSNFTGPKIGNQVTQKTLFRGKGNDELVGPYVSQLLYLPFMYGGNPFEQRVMEELNVPASATENGFRDLVNGAVDGPPNYSGNSYYIHNPRMLASYVHNDKLFQAYYNASMILLENGVNYAPGIPQNPREGNFVTMGAADIFSAIGTVSRLALMAAWHHKWNVNLHLRPEVMAGRVHYQENGISWYGIDPSNHGTPTITAMRLYNNLNYDTPSMFLPLMYPEGSPTHPEYPAGHSTVAGACVTILKAFLDTSQTWSSLGLTPQHSIDGISLVNYTEADTSSMTVLGEINKLASNIAHGRNMAGVHYRSAGDNGIVLGERVAIEFLRDLKDSYNEGNVSFNITKFDGTVEVI